MFKMPLAGLHRRKKPHWDRLTVLDRMTNWWLVSSCTKYAINNAKALVPATAILIILVRIHE